MSSLEVQGWRRCGGWRCAVANRPQDSRPIRSKSARSAAGRQSKTGPGKVVAGGNVAAPTAARDPSLVGTATVSDGVVGPRNTAAEVTRIAPGAVVVNLGGQRPSSSRRQRGVFMENN